MNFNRQRHAAAAVDGKIYVMGGYGSGGPLDSVEMYDPQTDSWQQVARMPQGRESHAAAAMGGKIYVSGGVVVGDSCTATLLAFDPQANTWTELASMGTARYGHTSAAIGGKLYVFGGFASATSAEAYDPISNTWAPALELSSTQCYSVAVAL